MGYNSNSKIRYANFRIFKGDLGSELLSEIPTFSIRDSLTNEIKSTGTLSYWGDDTSNDKAQSGEHVYRIDLSLLTDGSYYIVVDGIGRSHYFGVGDKYSRKIARTHLKGLYHQGCGIALEQPHTKHERGSCYHEVAFTKTQENGNDGQGWIEVPVDTMMQSVLGGYHDAGDYDRRIFHTNIPLLMLNYFEAFEDHFIDNQFNIPESGNGIPDFFR